MNHDRYAIGLDFGALNGRALLVRVSDGKEVASAVHDYAHGVITDRLPADAGGTRLPRDFALQDPKDYLDVLKTTIPTVLRQANIRPEDVIGVGTAFSACTMLPVESDGTPLCFLPKWRSNPHAWVKTWKHGAAQAQADRINDLGRQRGEEFLKRYGGRYAREWLFAKILSTVEKSPDVYDAADEFIEACDWIVWQLVGRPRRSNCAAGFKAMWIKDKGGYPHYDFFKALHPKLEHVLDEKLGKLDIYKIGASAGGLSRKAAALTGLKEGTPVAVGIIDVHAAAPACGVVEPGRLCMIMGGSIGHLLLARERRDVQGMLGVVEDGIVPGFWGYEAGQSSGADLLAWLYDSGATCEVNLEADRRNLSVSQLLEERAAALRPGQHGLLALDWWNGNRSVLMDPELSGVLAGATLDTKPHEVFRALLESVAFGTRKVVEAFTQAGLEVNELVACGALADRHPLLMQIFSDVTGRPVRIAGSSQTAALGAAMHATVAAGKAAGGYPGLPEAARHMARARTNDHYRPHRAAQDIYNQLYQEYEKLHDYFGRGANPVLKKLRKLKAGAA